MTKVSLIKGDDRFSNVLAALENAGEEVQRKIRGTVLIKVNNVMEDILAANTDPEALRAVLEFLEPLQPERIIVGEARAGDTTLFERSGFTDLQKDYAFELVDFDSTGYETLELLSIEQEPLPVKLTQIRQRCDCLISLSVPKAHSDAVLTLSGKNMMGFLAREETWKIHGVKDFGNHLAASTRVIHHNLRLLLARVRPDVAILDGFHSFEDGPVPQCGRGTRVEPRLALAGADYVAVDTVAARVFGFNPEDVGYLVYSVADGYGIGDMADIEVVGTSIEEACFPLKPAPTIDIILGWKNWASG